MSFKDINKLFIIFIRFFLRIFEYLTSKFKNELNEKEISNQKNIAIIYDTNATICREKGDFENALKYYKKSEKIRKKLDKKKLLINTYNNISEIYKNQKEFDKAIKYLIKNEKIYKEFDDTRNLANTYNNLGLIYRKKRDFEIALKYYIKGEEFCLPSDDIKLWSIIKFNISSLYALRGQLVDALATVKQTILVQEKMGYLSLNSSKRWQAMISNLQSLNLPKLIVKMTVHTLLEGEFKKNTKIIQS